MQLVEKSCPRRAVISGDHPLVSRIPTTTYGDSYAFGPVLVPADAKPNAAQLGSGRFYFGIDRPALWIKEFGNGAAGNAIAGNRGAEDYAVVFSSAVPLPPELLRECARYAGCNIWSEQNGVVYASGNFVALHSAKSGRFTLHLPGRFTVKDFYTSKVVATDANQFEVEIKEPDTTLFLFDSK
jgi:hypothetical protein